VAWGTASRDEGVAPSGATVAAASGDQQLLAHLDQVRIGQVVGLGDRLPGDAELVADLRQVVAVDHPIGSRLAAARRQGQRLSRPDQVGIDDLRVGADQRVQ
jgi:hypothetical protein